MCLLVRFRNSGANGEAARIVVLDHGDGNLGSKIPYGTPSSISINIVVVAHRLATELFGMRETILVQRIQIQRGLLVGILTVTQHVGVFGGWLLNGQRLRPVLCSPLVNGGIVGGSMGERLAGQPTTFFEREALSVFDARSYQCVIVRIGDDGHSGAVLGRTANHGRTRTFPAVPRGPHWSCQRECPRGYAGRGF